MTITHSASNDIPSALLCQFDGTAPLAYGPHSAKWRAKFLDGSSTLVCEMHVRDALVGLRGWDCTFESLEEVQHVICARCGAQSTRMIPKGADIAPSPQVEFCDQCPPRCRTRFMPQQVSDKEASAVAINPKTGERAFPFWKPDDPLPESLKERGFVKVQHKHYRDLEKFSRSAGVINDIETDNRDGVEADYREAQREHRRRVDEAHRSVREDREALRRSRNQ